MSKNSRGFICFYIHFCPNQNNKSATGRKKARCFTSDPNLLMLPAAASLNCVRTPHSFTWTKHDVVGRLPSIETKVRMTILPRRASFLTPLESYGLTAFCRQPWFAWFNPEHRTQRCAWFKTTSSRWVTAEQMRRFLCRLWKSKNRLFVSGHNINTAVAKGVERTKLAWKHRVLA